MSDVKLGLVQSFFGTSAGDHAQTDANFGAASPVAAILMACWGTAINTRVGDVNMSIGAAESATSGELFAFASWSDTASANVNAASRQRQTEVCELLDPATGSRDGWTDFTSFSSNTVTWDVTNTYTSNFGNISLLLGGADLNVKVGTATLTTTQDAESFITTAFDMSNSVLLLFSQDEGWKTGFDAATADLHHCWGMGSYDGTTFRTASVSWSDNDPSAAGDPASYLHSTRILNKSSVADGTLTWSLEWTTVDGTGGGRVGLTVRDGAMGSGDIGYIAIGLPSDWNASVTVQDTQTGTPPLDKSYTPAGGTGWTPQILIQILTLIEATDAAKVDNTAGGLGMRFVIGTGADDEYCISSNIEDAAATTNTECGVHDSGFLNEDDGSGGYEMDLKSFDSGGWTDTFAATMGTAKKTICLIMGQDDAAGGLGIPIAAYHHNFHNQP